MYSSEDPLHLCRIIIIHVWVQDARGAPPNGIFRASMAMLSQGSVKHLERLMQVYNPEEKEEYRTAKRDCAGN